MILRTTLAVLLLSCVTTTAAEPLRWQLRDQTEVADDPGTFVARVREATWDPKATAVIICDVWDYHHSINAVRRLSEFAPRMNDVVAKARALGATIIHAPSDCMPAYVDHPARVRTLAVPKSAQYPREINEWCSISPAERKAVYPIDQSDGGSDDDEAEHAEWAAKLKALGRNPGTPWLKQSDAIVIDAERDYISDRGDEVWNVLEARGVKNVVLVGVHVNMCVLGRPFGLRRMVLGGKNVVLMRDLTDSMYNPKAWPYVSHYAGTDLIIDHIERYVCPTVTSDQLLGGKPFTFSGDKRPKLAVIIAEEGYDTARTLPRFVERELRRQFKVTYILGDPTKPHELPGLEALDDADVALISVRRKVLKPEQMAILRRFIAAGKPVVGIRTASHAFSLNNRPPPTGTEAWPTFDLDVFGAKYLAHSRIVAPVTIGPPDDGAALSDPLIAGLEALPYPRPGGLYQFAAPLLPQAKVLLQGNQYDKIDPVAWTFRRADGGWSFYTSLGEPADFQVPQFVKLLRRALFNAAGLTMKEARDWFPVVLPREDSRAAESSDAAPYWLRTVLRIPEDLRGVQIGVIEDKFAFADGAWLNGTPLKPAVFVTGDILFEISPDAFTPGEANLLVIHRRKCDVPRSREVPTLQVKGGIVARLSGGWQQTWDDDRSNADMPLPAKFGASTDMVIELPELRDLPK